MSSKQFSLNYQAASHLHNIYIFVKKIYWHIETAVLAVRVSRIQTGSLCHPGWVAQWLERLTGDQKFASLIPVWSSETFFWVCDKAWVANSFPLIYQAANHLHICVCVYIMSIHVKHFTISKLNGAQETMNTSYFLCQICLQINTL